MKKLRVSALSAYLMFALFAASCTPAATPTVAPTLAATSTPIPTETATLVPVPTSTEAPATATAAFAPYCQANAPTPAASCQLPIAEQSATYCTKKVPYNLITMNIGATYQVITTRVTCTDAGTLNGKQLVACTGPMAFNFKLQVCDPSCAAPTVQAGVTTCPQGTTYNDFQGCCSQETSVAPNCTVLSLDTTTCAMQCSSITSRTECNANINLCYWNRKQKACVPKETGN